MLVAIRNRQRAVRLQPDAVSACVEGALRAALAKATQQTFPAAGPFPIEVSVMFVNDRTMRALNRDYRAKDRTTDVLSFPQVDNAEMLAGMLSSLPEAGSIPLGDIVISIPQACRQAEELSVSLSDELARLLVHGVLHLVGYDHERSAADARVMRRLENTIFRRVGKNPLCLN